MILRRRIFCLVGLDYLSRKQALKRIKREILKNSDTILNTFTFYSAELTLNKLKDFLFNYSFGKEKIVIFKNPQKLSSPLKKFILRNIKKILTSSYLVFEVEDDCERFFKNRKITQDPFFSYIFKNSIIRKIHSFSEVNPLNRFITLVRRNRTIMALDSLEKILAHSGKSSQVEMQILGVLTKEFSGLNDLSQKRKYLELLWETDRLIKEKGVKPHLALERLVIKLATLQN